VSDFKVIAAVKSQVINPVSWMIWHLLARICLLANCSLLVCQNFNCNYTL